jgi:hypothetical protein
MAIGAQKAQVLGPIVHRVSIDVIDMENKLVTLPLRPDAAVPTSLWYPYFEHGPVEHASLLASRSFGQHAEDFFGPSPFRTCRSPVMDAASEMAGVYAQALELPADVVMRSAAPFDAEVTQHSCDAGRVSRSIA